MSRTKPLAGVVFVVAERLAGVVVVVEVVVDVVKETNTPEF